MDFLVYIVMGTSHLAKRQVSAIIRQQSPSPCYVYGESASPRKAFDDVDDWFGAQRLASMVTVIDSIEPNAETITQLEHSDTVVVTGEQLAAVKRWVHMLAPRARVCTLDTLRLGQREFQPDRTPFLSRCYASLRAAATLPPLQVACEVTPLDDYSVCLRAQRGFARADWQQIAQQWPAQVRRAFGVVSIDQTLHLVDKRGSGNLQLAPTHNQSTVSELVLVGDLQTSMGWAQRLAKMVWAP